MAVYEVCLIRIRFLFFHVQYWFYGYANVRIRRKQLNAHIAHIDDDWTGLIKGSIKSLVFPKVKQFVRFCRCRNIHQLCSSFSTPNSDFLGQINNSCRSPNPSPLRDDSLKLLLASETEGAFERILFQELRWNMQNVTAMLNTNPKKKAFRSSFCSSKNSGFARSLPWKKLGCQSRQVTYIFFRAKVDYFFRHAT